MMIKKSVLGKQYVLDLNGCDEKVLSRVDGVQEVMNKSAVESGATVIDQKFHQFSPYGVSGVIIISESHFAIHTWPEHGYCAIDMFTCSDTIDIDLAVKILSEGFGAGRSELRLIERSLQA